MTVAGVPLVIIIHYYYGNVNAFPYSFSELELLTSLLLRERAAAVRRLKEPAQFNVKAVLTVRVSQASAILCLLRLEKVPAGRRADEGYRIDQISL